MAERLGRRHTGLAGQDLPAVLGGQQAEVQDVDLEAALALDDLAGDLDEPPGLGDLSGASLVVAHRSVDQQDS